MRVICDSLPPAVTYKMIRQAREAEKDFKELK